MWCTAGGFLEWKIYEPLFPRTKVHKVHGHHIWGGGGNLAGKNFFAQEEEPSHVAEAI